MASLYKHIGKGCNFNSKAKISYIILANTLSRKNLSGIVEPYNASRLLILRFWANQVKVITFMCAQSPAPHIVCGRKTLQMHGFPIQMYVTRFEKTLKFFFWNWCMFDKIELTHIRLLGWSHASLCLQSHQTPSNWEITALLWRFSILRENRKSVKWP